MEIYIGLIFTLLAGLLLPGVAYIVYYAVVAPHWNPLRQIAGPPVRKWFGNHLSSVLECVPLCMCIAVDSDYDGTWNSPSVSPKVHEIFVQRYGRAVHIRGVGPVSSI